MSVRPVPRPVPLPDNLPRVPPHLGLSNKIEGIRRAYSTLLKIQKSIPSFIDTRGFREQQRLKLMRVRILGYLILKGPSLTASEFVAEEVNSYKEDEDQIDKFGEMFFLHYLRIFRKYGGRTPASSRSSCNAFETRKEMIMKMLREADQPPQNHREAKRLLDLLKALVRDNFQCVVSGRYDSDSVVTNDELEAKVLSEELPMGITHSLAAHIFPDSIDRDISGSKDEAVALVTDCLNAKKTCKARTQTSQTNVEILKEVNFACINQVKEEQIKAMVDRVLEFRPDPEITEKGRFVDWFF
ncbi:hypothetical protein EDB86DRAFT_3077322 [Lactarius hatsudake]|nr:hypothetical protein EDB86DRAFT_3077322 [Lactarius hatsudake]